MQVTLTLEGFNFIPEPIRLRLQLRPGTVLEFDETTPFLKAVPANPTPEKPRRRPLDVLRDCPEKDFFAPMDWGNTEQLNPPVFE